MNRILLTLCVALTAADCSLAQAPRTLGFQGVLTAPNGIRKPDGDYSVTVQIYDALAGGTALWSEAKTVNVRGGVFATTLGSVVPFPAAVSFSDKPYYVGVSIASDPELTPRLPLCGVPYALALPGLRTEATVFSDQPGEFGTAGTPATPNVVGGFGGNFAGPGVKGATIAGGGGLLIGYPSFHNRVLDDYGVIGGGNGNTAGDGLGLLFDRFYATVGGGVANSATNAYSTVAGGHVNTANGPAATIAGGYVNTANGSSSFIGSGFYNRTDGASSAIGGGNSNQTMADGGFIGGGGSVDIPDFTRGNRVTDTFGAVVGGGNNQAGNGADNPLDASYAFVGGGLNNTAGGAYSAVPGGMGNTATGTASFAAGNRAKATHAGSFVWSDGQAGDFVSTATNQFSARATGGFRFVTAVDPITLAPSAGVSLAPGDNAWSVLSDRNAKTDFAAVDARQALRSVIEMPIRTWAYKTQPGVRHIGPMAQDFAAAFRVGPDDRHISTVDADGVALAAIQGLYDVVAEKDAEIAGLKQRNDALDARLRAVERFVANLARRSQAR